LAPIFHSPPAHALDPQDLFVTHYVKDKTVTFAGYPTPEFPGAVGSVRIKYRLYYRIYFAGPRAGWITPTMITLKQGKTHSFLTGGWPTLAQKVKYHFTIKDGNGTSGITQTWNKHHGLHYKEWIHSLTALSHWHGADPKICMRVKIAEYGPDASWTHMGCNDLNTDGIRF